MIICVGKILRGFSKNKSSAPLKSFQDYVGAL